MTRVAAFALMLLGMFACSPNDFMARLATPARDARARHYIDLLATGQHDSLTSHSRGLGDSAAVAKGFQQIDSVFQGQRLDGLKMIGANLFTSGAREQLNLTYEGKGKRGWVVVSIATIDTAGDWFIDGAHAEVIPGELASLNEFRLSGRSPVHYVMLLLVGVCLSASIGMAVFLATRRQFPRRWRWVMASLVSVGAIELNWATSQVAFSVFSLHLFGGSFVRASEFSPVLLAASFPLGALVAWDRYRRWLLAPIPAALPVAHDQ